MHARPRSAAEARAVRGLEFPPVAHPQPVEKSGRSETSGFSKPPRTKRETSAHRAAQLEVTGAIDYAGKPVAPCARCATMYSSSALVLDDHGRLVCRRCRGTANG